MLLLVMLSFLRGNNDDLKNEDSTLEKSVVALHMENKEKESFSALLKNEDTELETQLSIDIEGQKSDNRALVERKNQNVACVLFLVLIFAVFIALWIAHKY